MSPFTTSDERQAYWSVDRLTQDFSKLEKFILVSTRVIGTLQRPIRLVALIIALFVLTGWQFQSLRTGLGISALIFCFLSPNVARISINIIYMIWVAPSRRDKLDQLAKSVIDGTDQNYCVFLRPFEFDGCYRVVTAGVRGFGPAMIVDIEGFFAGFTKMLRIPLIALGGTMQMRGWDRRGGRVSVGDDDDWKTRIDRAIRDCRACFIIPAPNPGTLWELELIASRPDVLEKTLFVMPPRPRRSVLTGAEFVRFIQTVEHNWKETQKLVATFGIVLPDYTETGSIFSLPSLNSQPQVLSPLAPMTQEGMDKLFDYLIERTDPECVASRQCSARSGGAP